MLCLFYWLMFLPICVYMLQMLLPYLFVADVTAIIHCWLMLLPFLCVAVIVWQMLLPLWLVVLPFDVIYVTNVICQGCRWNSLPRWVWFMVRCYNHKWQMEWPQGHLFYFSLSSELKKDQERMVITADKAVSMVVMDREDCDKKTEELLSQLTYRVLPSDPTTKQKNMLIALLKTIKAEGGISDTIYKRLYPTGASTPKYYGLPKVHKEGIPLRPIISSRGAVTYESAKELSRILKPLVSRSPHHVHNTQDFIQSIEGIQLQENEYIMSYDVNSLFTSIPIDPDINIIKKHLEQDKDLHQRTNMTVNHICCLLEFCLKNTYFQFKGRYYEQMEGAAMGSPISPIVANLFMEDLEVQAIMKSPLPPVLWKMFVYDTFTIIKKQQKNSFLEHLNSINPSIKYTSQETRTDGSIPFLDILITPKDDVSLQTSVYRNPHTLTYIYSGTATTQFHQNTVWWEHCITQQNHLLK